LKPEIHCPAFVINFGEKNEALNALVYDLDELVESAKVRQDVCGHWDKFANSVGVTTLKYRRKTKSLDAIYGIVR
jgi:hypothetical protein